MLTMLSLPLPVPNSPQSPPPSSSSLLTDLKSCKAMTELKQLHSLAIKTGRIHDTVIAAEILRFVALSEERDLPYARLLLDRMREPNCFSWNTTIRAFSEAHDGALEGLRIYVQMLREGAVGPNRYTYPSVLKACAGIGGIEEGKQVHGHVVKVGLDSDEFVVSNLVRVYAVCGSMDDALKVYAKCPLPPSSEAGVVLTNAVIDGYFRRGMVGIAREMFDRMPCKSIVSWNGVIAGYVENGLFREAVDVFRKMQIEAVKPNFVTLLSILPAISRLGALDLGKWIHIYVEKNDIQVDDVLGSALIDMYAKCGNIDKSLQVFEGLPKKSNAIVWSALIGGLASHGRAEDALDYFSSMEKAGVTPSNVVFISVLNACSHAGLVDRGRAYFKKMAGVYRLKPRLEHYGCMVDMFGRAGLLEEAEELVQKMPMTPDDVILKALLSACRIHGRVEIGTRVAKQLMEMVPQDSGSYVLLSNLYASAENWDAVAMVRLMMKELDIRKDAGCSWITVDGITHEFTVEDRSHPRTREIYSMLEEMASKLMSAGHASDKSQVLLNIDEEEKESFLKYHSEKIAIAFGLIATSPGSTLQVIKNLRVCSNCHSSIKLISQFYNRKIVVRDRSRFHHFENGHCSCNDYW